MNAATITLVVLSCGQVPTSNFPSPSLSRYESQPAVISEQNGTEPRFNLSDTAPPASYNLPAQLQSPVVRSSQSAATNPSFSPSATQREADRTRAAIDLALEICREATASAGVEGVDVSLLQIMNRLEDSASRQRAVQAYWQLVSALAERNYAHDESRTLSSLPPAATRGDQSLSQAEQSRAAAREAEAELNLLERQEELAEAMALAADQLPRPIDVPFIGVYRTNLETIFASRNVPRRLRQIDRALPRQLEVITRRAESIAAAEQAIGELARSYQQSGNGLASLLVAIQDLSQQRRSLVADVVSYNSDIAEYALAVVGPTTAPETLVGTLILSDPTAQPALLADSRVRPASAEGPAKAAIPAGDDQLAPIAQPPVSLPGGRFEATSESPSILRRVIVDHR